MSRDALVVGINTYQWDHLADLRSPAEDAEAIAQCLEQYGNFRTWRLPEFRDPFADGDRTVGRHAAVTLEALETALVQLFKPTGQHIPDTALFFFSGHGLRKNRGIQEGFLATSDVNPEQGNWGLSLQWLRRLLNESSVRQPIVWLDCCHSGEALNFRDTHPNPSSDQSVFLIAASREFESAYTDVASEHSVLTAALLEGLDPKRQPSGVVTNDSLIQSIHQRLKREIQQPLWLNPNREIILTGYRQSPLIPNLEGVCPYQGLRPFSAEQAAYFYGREHLTDQLLKRVQIGQGNFVALIGASGSGKSSVLQAGLIYQLRQGYKQSGSDGWRIRMLTPKAQPLEALAAAFLDEQATDLERTQQLQQAETAIAQGSHGLALLIKATQAPRTLLVIDQFEEVFTLCSDAAQRQQFLDCLLGALTETGDRLCIVMAMRADFMGKCTEQHYGGLAQLIQSHLVLIEPMSAAELKRAIQAPAEQVGLRIDDHLVTQILIDLSIEETAAPQATEDLVPNWEPGSLPLLEYTLEQLWQYRTLDRLTLDSYVQLGGVRKALENRADAIYQSFSPVEQQIAKRVFLALTHLGEGTEDTRRRVLMQDLVNPRSPSELVHHVIQTLAAERLIVTSQVATKGEMPAFEEVIDIAHEALIRHWRRLRQWLSGNREAIRIARKLEAAAHEWQNHHQPEELAYLLQGTRLTEAMLFLEEYGDLGLLSALAQQFIETSQRVNARLERDRRNRQRLQIGGIITFLLVIATSTSLLGWQQRQARQTLEAVFLSQNSEQVVQALPQFFDTAEQLSQQPSEQNIRLALSYYRHIVAITSELQLEETNHSHELQTAHHFAEAQLAALIQQYRLQTLQNDLAQQKIGEMKPEISFTALENQYTEGALRTTYQLLMRELGAGADLNRDGQLSETEANLMPCQTLLAIERLWQQARVNCSWDNPACLAISIDAANTAQQSLAIAIFDYIGVDYAMNRIQTCKAALPQHN